MTTPRNVFWNAWDEHLKTDQDPSEVTIDAFIVAAEVIERWVDIAPKEFEHDGEIILRHMARFIDALPSVVVKH